MVRSPQTPAVSQRLRLLALTHVSDTGDGEGTVTAGTGAHRGRPFVVELVGVAGAGKTTLLRALQQRDTTIRPVLRISPLRHGTRVLWNAASLLPVFVDLLARSPRFLWHSARHLVRLKTFPAELAREASDSPGTLIVDRGPLFTFSRLNAFRDPDLESALFDRCVDRALERWAKTLDALVWLDAPDAVLTERIRSRDEPHRVKERPDDAIHEFLGRYRRSYEAVIARLAAAGVAVLRFDSATASAERIAETVAATLQGKRRALQSAARAAEALTPCGH